MKRLLFETLAGRAVVVGLIIKLVAFLLRFRVNPLPAFAAGIDTVASLMVAAGGLMLLASALASATRRLLWRVRRKLIISYIFVGFVPAVLIVAFFLLAGLLLFSNFSSYLVQTRLGALTDRARAIAEATALEVQRGGDVATLISRRQQAASAMFPGASIAVVRAEPACGGQRPDAQAAAVSGGEIAGPWVHSQPPPSIPGWIGCDDFGGLLTYETPSSELRLVARGVAFPASDHPLYAVVTDLPVNDMERDQLRQTTGVWLFRVSLVAPEAKPLPSASTGSRSTDAVPRTEPEAAPASPLNSVTFVDTRDWESGADARVMLTIQLNVADVYSSLSAAQGSAAQMFRQGLLVALLVIGVLMLGIQFVALIAGLTLARSITGSVHELFVGTERVRQGDFTHKIAVTSSDQLGELAQSFNTMTASIQDLLVQAAEKKRLEEELRIAHEIQMSLLPQGPLQMEGLSVTALCVPAREVGGDYYDFLAIDDHRVGVLIADVSGKGTSAALYMAELKGLVLSLARIYTSPRALLIAANQLIAEHLDNRSFITIAYSVLDLAAGTMTYARAGHTPLIYVPGPAAADRAARILTPDGMVLGLKLDRGEMFEHLLEEQTIPLRPGDVYVFFTDGVSEAMNADDDLFGEQRLGRLVEEHADMPATELRERVLREIAAFVGEAPQHDDMTMILLKVEEPGAGLRSGRIEPAVVEA